MGVFVFKDILLLGSIIQLVWVKMIKSFLQIKMENTRHTTRDNQNLNKTIEYK